MKHICLLHMDIYIYIHIYICRLLQKLIYECFFVYTYSLVYLRICISIVSYRFDVAATSARLEGLRRCTRRLQRSNELIETEGFDHQSAPSGI